MIIGREKFTQNENLTHTIFFMLLTSIVSVVFPHIEKVISIIGGLVAVSICFLLPTIC